MTLKSKSVEYFTTQPQYNSKLPSNPSPILVEIHVLNHLERNWLWISELVSIKNCIVFAVCKLRILQCSIFSCPKQLNGSLTDSLSHTLTDSGYFYFWHTKSDPKDMWSLIRVTRNPTWSYHVKRVLAVATCTLATRLESRILKCTTLVDNTFLLNLNTHWFNQCRSSFLSSIPSWVRIRSWHSWSPLRRC